MKKQPSKPADKRRILVADDHPLFREGLVQLINREHDLSCCGETGTFAATQAAVACVSAAAQPELTIPHSALVN